MGLIKALTLAHPEPACQIDLTPVVPAWNNKGRLLSNIDLAPSLQFLGAAGTVTGSRHLLRFNGRRYLIDCGLFQGLKALRLKNWRPLPFEAEEIEAVILTHAHIDHSGWLPRLCALEWKGTAHCTAGTGALLDILLPDAAHLQEEEAAFANRHGYSKHHPALPLYTDTDAREALSRVRTWPYRQWVPLADGLEFQFFPSGHLLGSASVLLRWGEGEERRTLLVSGDLGKYDDPFMADPVTPDHGLTVDYLVMESTYGDRRHEDREITPRLAVIVNETLKAGGVLLIPSFAVGRTQEVLFYLGEAEEKGLIPVLDVIVDSPMAIDATDLYRSHPQEVNFDWSREGGRRRLLTRRTRFTRTRSESMALNEIRTGAIIISANGMATGGRILHHLAVRLPHAANTVMFAGYQVEGTRGRTMINGAASVRMMGMDIPVRARIENFQGFSAHGDQGDLLRWARSLHSVPRRTFVVHGEKTSANTFRELLENQLGHRSVVPDMDTTWPLT